MKTKAISLFILISIFLNVVIVNAETSTVTLRGKVVDENDKPVEYATTALINPKTKEIINGDVSNERGEFIFKKIQKGDYILVVSMMGYEKFETDRVVVDGQSGQIVRKIVIKEHTEEISGIEVVGNKQFVEQAVDNIVINPEASITSATELT
jgi:hypothetical protein